MVSFRKSLAASLGFALMVATAASVHADVTWSGAVVVPDGEDVTCSDLSAVTSLSIGAGATVRFTTAAPHRFPITGTGTIVKESADEWTLDTGIPNFKGDYVISNGVVTVTVGSACGYDNNNHNVFVRNGATLALKDENSPIAYRRIHIAGAGAATRNGALEMPAKSLTGQLLNYIYLDEDATVYVPQNGLFFLRSSLDLAGHRATFAGGGGPTIIYPCPVSRTGEMYVEKGPASRTTLYLRGDGHGNSQYDIVPGSNTIVMTGTTTVSLWGGMKPVNSPLWISGTGNILTHDANNTYAATGACHNTHANWAGPIVFTNETGLSNLSIRMTPGDGYGACTFVVGGQISGNGSVSVMRSGNVTNRIAILNPNNTYTGATTIDNGSIGCSAILGYPGSIPNENFSMVTCKVGFVDLAVGDNCSRWTYDAALRFRSESTFENSCRPRFNGELASDGIGSMKFQVAEGTPTDVFLESLGTVCFEGAGNETPIPFNWRGGTARFTGPMTALVGDVTLKNTATDGSEIKMVLDGADMVLYETNTMYLGQWECGPVRLVVTNSVLRTSNVMKDDFYTGYPNADWGGPTRGGAIFAGQYSPGILEVLDGAVISNRIIVSGYLASGCGYGSKQGAVYQRGGHVVALGATKGHHTSCVGMTQAANGSGYYELSGGTLEARGQFIIGGYTYGCFAQYGGHVISTNRLSAAPTTLQTGLSMASCNQGYGTLYIKKGTWDLFVYDIYLGQGATPFPTADITLDGEEASFDAHDRPMYVAYTSSFGKYALNLNGGVMRCGGVRLHKNSVEEGATNNLLFVNFNGGTFKAGSSSKNLFGYGAGSDKPHWCSTNVVVYSGGATIDTDGKTGNCINSPILGAWGKRVKSITMANPPSGSDYVGALRVVIDGDGLGATAFVEYDSKNMAVGDVLVTSPGYGYTTATATVYYGKSVRNVNAVVELEDNENTGSFTKKGAGDLTLNATNTWGGATVVAGGTLKAGCDWAIPSNTVVRLGGGGTLDLNGKAASIASVVYTAGGGTIVNASAATLPDSFSLATTVDDIVAGRPIVFSGDQDFSGKTLTVEGADFSALDENVRVYRVLTVDGGELLGAPAIVAEPPPEPWRYVVRRNGVTLSRVEGTVFMIR